MPTKKRTPDPKTEEAPPEPRNVKGETETEELCRHLDEARAESRRLLAQTLKLATDSAVLMVENSRLKDSVKSMLETEVRLLTALIADGDALKVYREQALEESRKRLINISATHDKGGKDKTVWSAWTFDDAGHEWVKHEPQDDISYPRP